MNDLNLIDNIYIYGNDFNISYFHMLIENLNFFYFLNRKNVTETKIYNVYIYKTYLYEGSLQMANFYFTFFNLPFRFVLIEQHVYDNLPIDINNKTFFLRDNNLFIHKDFVRKSFFTKNEKIEYFSYIRSFANKNLKYKGKKIFINRRNSRRRVSSKLSNIFKEKGYEEYFFEDVSFKDQMDICYNCSEILAVHGAALANIVFGGNNLCVKEISVNHNENCYSNLVKMTNTFFNTKINLIKINSPYNIKTPLIEEIDTLLI